MDNSQKTPYIVLVIISIVIAIAAFVYAAVNLSRWYDALEYPEVQFAIGLCVCAVIAVIIGFVKLSNANNTDSYTDKETSYERPVTSKSVDEELIRYKRLLDQGVITQEEFEKKKKQLLDL